MRTIAEVTKRLVEKYDLQKWFLGEPRGRAYAWDILKYVEENVHKDSKILEMGCGVGQNLVELWVRGFWNLHGIENDLRTYDACLEMLKQFDAGVSVDCLNAQDDSPWKDFDVIAPLNFTYRKEIDMVTFLPHVRAMLKQGGLLIIDIISSRLEENRAPEYVHRFSEKKFLALAKDFKLKEVYSYFPRYVYFMEAI